MLIIKSETLIICYFYHERNIAFAPTSAFPSCHFVGNENNKQKP